MKKLTRDETEHGQKYYLVAEVDAFLARAAQNDTLLQAREVAAAYREQNSQVDSGNLYWALMKCLEFIDARSVQPKQGSLEELRQMLQIEVDRLIAAKVPERQQLTDIQLAAHNIGGATK